ncbi:MAG: radical SAM protein [Clostridia bacterium]|nr:radical SAM protein [Clostridia bacterium]
MEEIKGNDSGSLFGYTGLTQLQKENSKLNILESEQGRTMLASYPRRIVLELTNACNPGCITSARSHAELNQDFFKKEWLKVLEPAFDYAEEMTLTGRGEPTLHPDFQHFLEFAGHFPIKKHILTNGTRLREISPWIFEYKIDLITVSLDGPDSATNNRIHSGLDLKKIVGDLRELVVRRYFAPVKPYINTVTTLMKSNLDVFPRMIDLAADIGIEEVKGVYLTAFSKESEGETLFDIPGKTEEIFNIARERAESYNIVLSLPHIPGKDPAGDSVHRHCHLAWRDLFAGCDGIIRTCMSPKNTLGYLPFAGSSFMNEIRNSSEAVDFRARVNGPAPGMNEACRKCYQPSCANKNLMHAFVQESE